MIPVIYGSVRSGRQGLRVANFLASKLEERGHRAPLIDPAVYALPLLDKRLMDYAEGEAPEVLQTLAGILAPADGYVVVSAEYNSSVPPALSNLLDHFVTEYARCPALIATYSPGAFGGARVGEQLRSLLGALGMLVIPGNLAVPGMTKAFDENGVPADPEAWDKRADRVLGNLEWYATALRNAREADAQGKS